MNNPVVSKGPLVCSDGNDCLWTKITNVFMIIKAMNFDTNDDITHYYTPFNKVCVETSLLFAEVSSATSF